MPGELIDNIVLRFKHTAASIKKSLLIRSVSRLIFFSAKAIRAATWP
jgi:hypothetical protein